MNESNTPRIANPWGYIDLNGKMVIPFQFEHGEPFYEGLAVVKVRGLQGCIDKEGRWVIPPHYEGLNGFEPDGWCPAGRDGKWGYIDRSNKFVIRPSFDFASPFSLDGIAQVKINGRYGFIDRTGKSVVPPQYEFAEDFREGFALVHDPSNYSARWFIDRDGEKVHGPFSDASSFSEGWASVVIGDQSCFINTSGEVVLRLPPRIWPQDYREGLCPTEDQTHSFDGVYLQGYISRSGQWAIQPRYNHAGFFACDLAVVRVDKNRGCINKQGEFVIPPHFDDVGRMCEGRALVRLRGSTGFVDDRGAIVIEPVYFSGQRFSEGLAPVATRG